MQKLVLAPEALEQNEEGSEEVGLEGRVEEGEMREEAMVGARVRV